MQHRNRRFVLRVRPFLTNSRVTAAALALLSCCGCQSPYYNPYGYSGYPYGTPGYFGAPGAPVMQPGQVTPGPTAPMYVPPGGGVSFPPDTQQYEPIPTPGSSGDTLPDMSEDPWFDKSDTEVPLPRDSGMFEEETDSFGFNEPDTATHVEAGKFVPPVDKARTHTVSTTATGLQQFDHDADYHTVAGLLSYNGDHRRWQVIYQMIDGDSDPYGGKFFLAKEHPACTSLRDDFVLIEGERSDAMYEGRPLYVVHRIRGQDIDIEHGSR